MRPAACTLTGMTPPASLRSTTPDRVDSSTVSGPKLWRAALWCAVVALPLAALATRFACHQGSYFDGEGQIPPTIARILQLCTVRDIFMYQMVPNQGSLVLDPLLAQPSYAVLGPKLIAWHAVGLFWATILAASAAVIAWRAAGLRGAVLCSLLLAGAPFLIKDGQIAIIGGHASGAAFGVMALAFAVSCGRGRRVVRAIAAGASLGMGTWYVPTVGLALPGVAAAALLVGGRRTAIGLPIGLLALPLLVGVNVHGLAAVDGTYGPDPLVLIPKVVGFGFGPSTELDGPTAAAKAAEAGGPAFWRLLYRQRPGTRLAAPRGTDLAGRAWSWSWVASGPLLLFALIGRRREPDDGPGTPPEATAAVVGVLLCASALFAAYVFLGVRVEETIVNQAADPLTWGPDLNGPRYIVPLYLWWTVALAVACGLLSRSRWRAVRPLGPAIALFLAGLGLFLAGHDVVFDREPPPPAGLEVPWNYAAPRSLARRAMIHRHLRCLGPDEDSRAFHLKWIAPAFGVEPEALLADPSAESRELEEFLDGPGAALTPADQLAIVEELGRQMGGYVTQPESPADEALRAARLSAWSFGGELGCAYLAGFITTIDLGPFDGSRRKASMVVCAPDEEGRTPPCPAASDL